MTQFAYRARDRRGAMVSGVMTAESRDDLTQRLQVQGMNVLSVVRRSGGGGGLLNVQVFAPRITRKDIVFFANQLAVMVDTGVPLAEALDAIVQQSSNPTFQRVLARIAEDVESGETFSDALEKHPKHFNTMFVSLARSGEAAGNLGEMLTNVAEHLVEAQDTRRQVFGALAYPAFMITMAAVVVVVLLTVVLPKFTTIYAHKNAVLPAPTRVLLGVSTFCTTYWIPIVAVLVALVSGAVLFFRSTTGRRVADTLKLRLPLLGRVMQKYYMARSFRALGTMVTAGVPVMTALEIARTTATNSHFADIFDRAVEKVSQGEMLSDQFFCAEYIPVTTAQMVFAGEKAGRLGEVLLKVSSFANQDLKGAVKQMTTLLEPALIAVMGLFVGGVAISLLLPMFTINKVMR